MKLNRQKIDTIIILTAAVTLLLLLSACAEYVASNVPPQPPAKLLQLEETRFSHEVKFERGSVTLSNTELKNIDAFLRRIRTNEHDRIELPPVPAEPGAQSRRRREVVAAYLELRGIHALQRGTKPEAAPAVENSVRLSVARYSVATPACPDWTKVTRHNFTNTVHSNFDCATAVNFGHMLARPADLRAPLAPGPMDGEFAAGAIERYRKGETIPLEGTPTSEVAPAAAPAAPTGGGTP